MYFVYVLQCDDGSLVPGYTTRLDTKLAQHHAGEVRATRHRLPVTLVYYEAHRAQGDALRRQRYFRTAAGKETLGKILKDGLRDAAFA